MFKTLAALVPKDKDLPDRAHTIDVRNRFLDGTIYDGLQYEFHQEYADSGEYIPIARRAPSVRYALPSVVVSDSVSFLFAEGRFPTIDCDKDEASEETLTGIIKDCRINDVMIDAAMRGSVGSVCIWVRVLKSRLFVEALTTTYLTPTWKPDAPDTLLRVREEYKVRGKDLKARGYAIDAKDMETHFWFRRDWTETQEIWFLPWKVSEAKPKIEIDTAPNRTVTHGFGFVPMIWVINLPGGDKVDGACTFRLAINSGIEIDYQLSQAGRGLKYSSSPTLTIMSDGNSPPKEKHVVGDALILPSEGDAKLLEISGDAAKAVIEYVREVRKLALESVGGSRADSDKLSAATSGRAMELMNQALINLADKLRSSYGEGALLKLMKMIAAISRILDLLDSDGNKIAPIASTVKIGLVWPRWYAPTADDRQADAVALNTLTGGRPVLSTETAVNALAGDYDIEDVQAEMTRIAGDAKADLETQTALLQAKPVAKPQDQ